MRSFRSIIQREERRVYKSLDFATQFSRHRRMLNVCMLLSTGGFLKLSSMHSQGYFFRNRRKYISATRIPTDFLLYNLPGAWFDIK